MDTHNTNSLPLTLARIAGFLYLFLYFPLSLFGFIYVTSHLIVKRTAVATTNKIMVAESLFRLGFVTTIAGQVVGLLMILTIYKLLKLVNKDVAMLMVLFGMVAVSVGVGAMY